MPSLNTLRTRGGVIVTIVIFLALIAFLVGDLFSAGGRIFASRQMRVGEINGHNVDYVEFSNESDYIGNIYSMMNGRSATSAQEQDMLYNTTWEQLIMKYSYEPSLERMGLSVSESEQIDMVNGAYLSPVITQTFANPATGMFDQEIMKNFMGNVGLDQGATTIWNYLKEQMTDNRIMTKYMALVTNGFYTTTPEADNAVATAGKTYDVRIVSKPYNSIPDSLVNISDSQIKNYYDSHREKFRQTASRDVEYVLFDVIPSSDDYSAAAEYINTIADDFRSSDSPMQYATLNSQERPDQNYYGESALRTELAAIAFGSQKGEMYGPVLNGDTYTLSRVADTRMMPDSLGAKHILVPPTQKKLADSLVDAIRKGADFEALAREHSIDQSALMNGGDLGHFAPEQMVKEFADAALKANKGDVYTVESQYGLHVVELTYKSRPVSKAQIATITYKIDPSAKTMQDIFTKATSFVTAAGKTSEEFRQAVSDQALSKRSIRIRNTDRTISGLDNSRELIRWAFTGKKGDVSAIMEIDGDYLVAALTDVKEEGYSPVDQVSAQIRTTLANEAKGDMIAAEMTGTSLDAIAEANGLEIKTAAGVQYSAFYIPEVGVEPALLGAISALPEGQLSKPVKGATGVYVFDITGIVADDSVTAETEKARLEANATSYLSERTMQALIEESDVEDMRVKFF